MRNICIAVGGGSGAVGGGDRPRVRKGAAGMPEGTTLDNLMAAYSGEMNANARYLAFAKKADEEGYGAVASLFRRRQGPSRSILNGMRRS